MAIFFKENFPKALGVSAKGYSLPTLLYDHDVPPYIDDPIGEGKCYISK